MKGMGILMVIAIILIVLTGIVDAKEIPTKVKVKLIAKNLTAPMALVSPDDGTGRLFIVDQTGIIKIKTKDGKTIEFLNISSKIVELNPGFDERGLLGLAFHP